MHVNGRFVEVQFLQKYFLDKKCRKNLEFNVKFVPLHPQSRDMHNEQLGVLVQLVRIHACHAWGHGFESRFPLFCPGGGMVDAHVSGACVERHAGSSPVLGTIY